jgi:putative ABC transport system permease protein
MNSIMVVLLVALGLSLCVVGYVVLRNRIMFRMGVRNIPRRVAQSVLIVIGLMLSTLIISAALTTGDTVDHSITKLAYDWLGHMDEAVVFDADERRRPPQGGGPRIRLGELQTALPTTPTLTASPPIFESVQSSTIARTSAPPPPWSASTPPPSTASPTTS